MIYRSISSEMHSLGRLAQQTHPGKKVPCTPEEERRHNPSKGVTLSRGQFGIKQNNRLSAAEVDGQKHCRRAEQPGAPRNRAGSRTIAPHPPTGPAARCEPASTEVTQQKRFCNHFGLESILHWPSPLLGFAFSYSRASEGKKSDRAQGKGFTRMTDF